ncbi:uncharacterized protein LOC129959507 [Argiope bruennichi]|uniref:uncharacterized protein LOC129959507 n=1 Tax=Argiope bruennichi TaxID=94029 RepID=UPI00249529DD|nr:uncharacterized protein LOC129959507 [Argiope bruennichi]
MILIKMGANLVIKHLKRLRKHFLWHFMKFDLNSSFFWYDRTYSTIKKTYETRQNLLQEKLLSNYVAAAHNCHSKYIRFGGVWLFLLIKDRSRTYKFRRETAACPPGIHRLFFATYERGRGENRRR